MSKKEVNNKYTLYFFGGYLLLLLSYLLCINFIWIYNAGENFLINYLKSNTDLLFMIVAYFFTFMFLKRFKRPKGLFYNCMCDVLGILSFIYIFYQIINYVSFYFTVDSFIWIYGICSLVLFLLPFLYFKNYLLVQDLKNRKKYNFKSLKNIKIVTIILIFMGVYSLLGTTGLISNSFLNKSIYLYFGIFIILLITFIIYNIKLNREVKE